MNILFYIPALSQEGGGVRQYSKGVLEIIAKDTKNKYFVYHNNNDPEILKVMSANPHLQLVKDSDVSFKQSKSKELAVRGWNALYRKIGVDKKVLAKTFADALCEKFAIDVIHCPYQYIPHTNKAKLITTLHDVQELHFPEFFSPRERASRALAYMDYIFRADNVIVSYNHVKQDIVKYFSIPENKISKLLINMNDLWINNFSEKNIVDVQSITGGEEFLLYPANTWRHKNHLNLLKAIALLRDKFNVNVKVICTGNKNEHFEQIQHLLKELKLEKQVVFAGIVSEEVLYSLYKNCKAVVVASLYEAGSFPLYESILLDVPVICSNVTSLPETVDNENGLFNPFDVENIACRIKQVWTDENFRLQLKENLKTAREKIKTNNPFPVLEEIYANI